MSRAITTEILPGSSLVVHQPKSGYRYSIDSFLLSDFVKLKKREKVLDLGSGVGIISLLLSSRFPDAMFWAIEIQNELHDCAVQNRDANNLGERIFPIYGDYRDLNQHVTAGAFTAAISNPPYYPIKTGRINPKSGRAIARHELYGGAWEAICTAARAVKKGGRLFIVYPAKRAIDLFDHFRQEGFEPKRMRFVHPTPERAAVMVMVEAIFGGGVELEVMCPLYVYSRDKEYSPEVSAILTQGSRQGYVGET